MTSSGLLDIADASHLMRSFFWRTIHLLMTAAALSFACSCGSSGVDSGHSPSSLPPATNTATPEATPAATGTLSSTEVAETQTPTPSSATPYPSATPTAENHAPEIGAVADRVTNVGFPLRFALTAEDADGDAVTWSLQSGTIPSSALNPDSGEFSWTPSEGDLQTSPHRVTFVAMDDGAPNPKSTAISISIRVRPKNHPPVLAPIGTQTVRAGDTLHLEVEASDPDAIGALLFTASGDPLVVDQFDASTGVLHWTVPESLPATRLEITISVTDDDPVNPKTASETIYIDVLDSSEDARHPPAQPVIISPTPDGVEGIAATDVHMETDVFVDLDGDMHSRSEWEIWDDVTDERVWAGHTEDLELTHAHLDNGRFEGSAAGKGLEFDHFYRLRVRFEDNSADAENEWSEWSEWRRFRTAPFGVVALEAGDVDVAPPSGWLDEEGQPLTVPVGVECSLLRAGASAEEDLEMVRWTSFPGGLRVNDGATLDAAGPVAVRVANLSRLEVAVPPSRLSVSVLDAENTDEARETIIYLPPLEIAAEEAVSFWVATNGATFWRQPDEVEPSFDKVAQETEEPWLLPPGFFVEEVVDGLAFPTGIAFASQIPRNPSEPSFYVMELKGTIWVVDGNGDKSVYAEDLIDFNSGAPTSNSGQVGLGGFAVEPATGDLIVTRTYRSPAPPQTWALTEDPPGLTLFLSGFADWWRGKTENRTARYVPLAEGERSEWTISGRVEFPVNFGQGPFPQTGGTAYGLVAYSDSDNAVSFSFQSRKHEVDLIRDDEATRLVERRVPFDGGWLRISYREGEVRFATRQAEDTPWEDFHTIEDLGFVPTRVGVYGRSWVQLISLGAFSDIEVNGTEVDPETLLDDTVPVANEYLRNQVLRLSSADGGRTADPERTGIVLDMPNDLSHPSHQIQDVEFLDDGTMLVSVGDGFYPLAGQDPERFTGKLLRLAPDGSAPADNPFYDSVEPESALSYTWASGVRNVFDMAVRRSDGRLFCSENGPNRDRFSSPEVGWNMGYDGSDDSMRTRAIFTWSPAVAPVGIEVMQTDAFPEAFRDWIFLATAGQDYVTGASKTGKRILAMQVDSVGELRAGPTEFLRYVGSAKATPVALAFGPDGLYFTTLYNTNPAANPLANARVLRVRAR